MATKPTRAHARRWPVSIRPGGRVVIPAELRKSLGVQVGDTLVFEESGGEVTLKAKAELLRSIQEKYKRHWLKPEFSADAFLAQRKASWGEK